MYTGRIVFIFCAIGWMPLSPAFGQDSNKDTIKNGVTQPLTAAFRAYVAQDGVPLVLAAAAVPQARPASQKLRPTGGTPDMRYKSNIEASKTPPQHLKRDGTPDQRYKQNVQKGTKQ
jgi:hypothetical protein